MKEITKIGLAVLQHNRILLVKKRGSKYYILPGGKPEAGEDDLATLYREINEELGCQIDYVSIKLVGTFVDRAAGAPDTKVIVRLYSGELVGTPEPRAEIDRLAWFRPQDELELALAPSLENSILPFLFGPCSVLSGLRSTLQNFGK